MTVADLQQFVRSLGGALSGAGAKAVAGDLERVAAGLAPFQALNLGQFADFLAQAESYARTGVVPTTGKGRSRTAARPDSAETIRAAGERIRGLYERAVEAGLQYTAIDAELKAIDKQLSKDEAVQVARDFGIAAALKTKKAAFEAIKRRISERKESAERTQFGAAPAL
jgi:hypothetical protein